MSNIKANAEELHFCAYSVFQLYQSVKTISSIMEHPHLAELLRREHSLEELERSEALLSVCITQLRALRQIKTNDAVILDLTARLGK